MINPQAATAIKAARAAAARRAVIAEAADRLEATARTDTGTRLRTGRRTQQAIDALINLRNDVQLGLPAAALLDRIDDELFKLKR